MRSSLVTVLRTVRSNRDSHGSLLFSHRAVLEAKRTEKMSSSRFSRSNHTVQSGFQNHGNFYKIYIKNNHFSNPLHIPKMNLSF